LVQLNPLETHELVELVDAPLPFRSLTDHARSGLESLQPQLVLTVSGASARRCHLMSEDLDLEELAETLRRLLAQIDEGSLLARPAFRHRVEGALAMIEVLLGQESTSLLDRLREDSA
jgi:hypothetical protein